MFLNLSQFFLFFSGLFCESYLLHHFAMIIFIWVWLYNTQLRGVTTDDK